MSTAGQKLSTVEEWWRTHERLGTQRGCWRGEREMLIPFWGHSQQGPSETWTTMPKSDSARKVRDNSLPDDAMKEDVFFTTNLCSIFNSDNFNWKKWYIDITDKKVAHCSTPFVLSEMTNCFREKLVLLSFYLLFLWV